MKNKRIIFNIFIGIIFVCLSFVLLNFKFVGVTACAEAEKGGSIYLQDNATFNMEGGTVSGSSAVKGGAIYISSGSTL